MMAVRCSGNYEQWVTFFITALSESAKDAYENILRLAALQERNIGLIKTLGRSKEMGLALLRYLEQNPIMKIGQAAEALHRSYNTVSSAVNRFIELGILVQSGGVKRSRTFSYKEYLKILKDRT